MTLTNRVQVLKSLGWKFKGGDAVLRHAVFCDWNDCSDMVFDVMSGLSKLKIMCLEKAGWSYDDSDCAWHKGESIWYDPLALSPAQLQRELENEN